MPGEADVNLPRGNCARQFRRPQAPDNQVEAVSRDLPQQVCHLLLRGKRVSDPYRVSRGACVPQVRRRPLPQFPGRTRLLQEHTTSGAELGPPQRTDEDRLVQGPLQRVDALGNRWLGNTELNGCAAEQTFL